MKLKPSFEIPDHTLLENVDLPTRIQNVLALNGIRTVGEPRGTREATLLTFQDLDIDRLRTFASIRVCHSGRHSAVARPFALSPVWGHAN